MGGKSSYASSSSSSSFQPKHHSRREQELINCLTSSAALSSWPASLFPVITAYCALDQQLYIAIGTGSIVPIYRRSVATFKQIPLSAASDAMLANETATASSSSSSSHQESDHKGMASVLTKLSNPDDYDWRQLPSVTPGRDHPMFTFYDGTLYYIGGLTNAFYYSHHHPQMRYLSVEPDWMPAEELPGRYSANVTSMWQTELGTEATSTAQRDRYRPTTARYVKKHAWHVTLGHQWYLGGGVDGDAQASRAITYFCCFDFLSRQWTVLPSMSRARRGAAVATWNGSIYVFGGWDGITLSGCVNHCEVYTPSSLTSGRWRALPDGLGKHTYGFALSLPQFGIAVFGGYTHNGARYETLPTHVLDGTNALHYYTLPIELITWPVKMASDIAMCVAMNDGTIIVRGTPHDIKRQDELLVMALPYGIGRLTALAQLARSTAAKKGGSSSSSVTASASTRTLDTAAIAAGTAAPISAVLVSSMTAPITIDDWIEVSWPKQWKKTKGVIGVTS